jgi:hypothetical protein
LKPGVAQQNPPVYVQPRPGDRPDSAAFKTILSPPGFEGARVERREQPACFTDLGRVDKVREVASPDAAECDSRLIFLREISRDPRLAE